MELGKDNVLTNPPDRVRTEIAVIGSGPGGAITACLLAEAGREVLLVEDGPFLSLDSCVPFSREEMVQKYRNGGITVTMGRAKIAYVEGRCVGGGSEINSGLYHRTPPEVLENWAREYQVEAITERDLQTHFEVCEHDLSVSTLVGDVPPASRKLQQGAAVLGWKSLEVPRWLRGDTKQSMTETLIPRFLRAGGRLLPQVHATRLVRHTDHWRVRCELRANESARRRLDIDADTVFIAAGSIQTPTLLRRSGFRRNVGNSLHMHPTVKVVARFPDEVNTPDMGVPAHQVKEFAPRFSFGCSVSSPPHLALALLHYPEALKNVGRHWRHMAVYYAMIRGGTGTVRPLPGFRDPLVRYRLGQSDWTDLADALRGLARCLLTAGAIELYPSLSNGPSIHGSTNLQRLPNSLDPRTTDLMTIHLFSSCPMGENKKLCAVDSFGRVHGVTNLYVADASLLCTAPGVNPQGSIMAFARRNALTFLRH